MHDKLAQEEIARLQAEYARRKKEFPEQDLYSLFNPSALFAFQQRQISLLKVLNRHGFFPLKDTRILEIGCGAGGVLAEFLKYGVDPYKLYGVDIISDLIQRAHHHMPQLPLAQGDGQRLPFPDGSFRLVMQYVALSSILVEDVRAQMAREMLRVLDPEHGIILSYDFWINPVNRQTHGIRPVELRKLFPNCAIELHKITLAPPIARRLIKVSWLLCHLLEKITLFNTHYLAVIRPNRQT